MQMLAQNGLRRAQNSEAARQTTAKAIGILAGFRDTIGKIVASSPAASLAWVGICGIMPVSWFPFQVVLRLGKKAYRPTGSSLKTR